MTTFKPRRLIWHHTGDSQEPHQFKKIDEYHKNRGFPQSSLGYYVGYHWLIERDGFVYVARTENEIGAHDQGENLDSLGIGLSGNFNHQLPSKEQVVALVELLDEIFERVGIRLYDIEPHRQDDATDCPGTMLDDDWLIRTYLLHKRKTLHWLFYWIGKRLFLL